MTRKPRARKRRKNKNVKRSRPPGRSSWMNVVESIEIIIGQSGDPAHALDDNCPICRELRQSGAEVFTIDENGDLVPVDVDTSDRPDSSLN